MGLPEILREKREALADRWRELVLESYPPQAVAFLRQEKDGFRNPVGATIRQAIDELTGVLVTGAGPEDPAAALDALVRMRAVQNFSPGQAVGFVFLFRRALVEVLRDELAGGACRGADRARMPASTIWLSGPGTGTPPAGTRCPSSAHERPRRGRTRC